MLTKKKKENNNKIFGEVNIETKAKQIIRQHQYIVFIFKKRKMNEYLKYELLKN